MSSHEELDEQYLDAVARDDERDLRMASRFRPGEFDTAVEKIGKWPEEWRDGLLKMTDNERRWIMLLAALLDASPESEEAP